MKTQPKQLSEAAQVAKICREYLKSKGIKCKATSSNYSMGNSVRVTVYNQSPDTMKMINTAFADYQQGHFNGMEDIYEYSNTNRDIPQTKYLFVENEYNDQIKQECWDFLRAKFPGNAEGKPESYADAQRAYFYPNGCYHEHTIGGVIYQTLNGSNTDKQTVSEFWAQYNKPVPIKQKTTSGNTIAHIEQHEHTKKGFLMHLVVLDARVDRDQFNEYRDLAVSMGGWYSRQWGKTPGGFAFKESDQADQFLAAISSETPTDEPPKPTKGQGDKLRAMADKLTSQIENKLADRQTNTPKRLAQANHSRLEGERLERTQKALYALADLHDAETVPDIMQGITTKSGVYDLMGTKKEMCPNGYHSYSVCTGKPSLDTPEAVALWSLIDGKTDEQKQADELRRKLDSLKFSNISGYFPTPDHVIDRMIELADLEPGHSVLDPELGSCSIALKVAPLVSQVKGYEINYTLAEIADYYDFLIERRDFLTVDPEEICSYDAIIMNPPFEKGADIKHIKHALKFLKPGCPLVAICSGGPKQQQELQPLADSWEILPAGTFKEAGTNIQSVLLTIRN